jgi:hypothetical protein
VDKQYDCLPTEIEWEFVVDVVERLRLFFRIIELYSGTNYVTANIFFPQICEIKAHMRKWSTSSNEIIGNMTKAMTLKFDKY